MEDRVKWQLRTPAQPILNDCPLRRREARICYARYADDLLLLLGIKGIVGAVENYELLIEIQKRIAHFLQSETGHSSAFLGDQQQYCIGRIEFLGTVIRVSFGKDQTTAVCRPSEKTPTPIQFLRELEKRLRVKYRIHITALKQTATIKCERNLSTGLELSVRRPDEDEQFYTPKKKSGSTSGNTNSCSWLEQFRVRSPFPVEAKTPTPPNIKEKRMQRDIDIMGDRQGQAKHSKKRMHWKIEAPIKKILRRLRDRGLISRIRPWPIHVACLTNDIVNWFAGIAISPLSYYRCRDNLYQVRTIVDYQIRWSAIFTLAHKLKSSARNIIPKYSKDLIKYSTGTHFNLMFSILVSRTARR